MTNRVWAVLDQALWSSAGLLLVIQVGRTAGADELGALAVAQAAQLAAAGIHSALLLEPMIVLGAVKDGSGRIAYSRWCVRMTLLGAAPVAALGALVMALTTSWPGLSLGLVTVPIVLAAWTARRAPLLNDAVWVSATGSAAYLMALCTAISLHGWAAELTAVRAIAFIAVASAAQLTAVGLLWLRRSPRSEGASGSGEFRAHWDYGRWILPLPMLSWVTTAGFLVFIALLLPAASAGELRAVQTLNLVFLLTASALAVERLPATSRLADAHQLRRLSRELRSLNRVLLALGIAWSGALLALAPEALKHMLPGSNVDRTVIAGVVIAGLVFTASDVAATGLRSLKATSDVLVGNGIGAIALIALIIPATSIWNLEGGVAALVIALCAQLGYMRRALGRRLARRTGAEHTGTSADPSFESSRTRP